MANRRIVDTLVSLLSSEHIGWKNLSANPNVTMDMVDESELPWDWSEMSKNPNVTLKFVLAHQDRKWNWAELSANPGITSQDIFQNPHLGWVWLAVSLNPNIRIQDVLAHPNVPWVDWAISVNPGIRLQDILENLSIIDWSRRQISRNPGITIDDLMANKMMDYPDDMSSNPNLRIHHVLNHKYVNRFSQWCLQDLVRNPGISMEDIARNPAFFGQIYSKLAANPAYTNQRRDNHTCSLAGNPNIDIIYIRKIKDWSAVSWTALSANARLRIDDVLNNLDLPWDFAALMKNRFTLEHIDYNARRHVAAVKIQVHWRKASTDHTYKLCWSVQSKRVFNKC